MPPLVRRYVKTSFVFLTLGLLLGGWIIVGEFVLGASPPRLFVTAHVHLLLVGFMLMVVMGVATWMFPRGPRRGALSSRVRGGGVLRHDRLHRRPGRRRDPGAVSSGPAWRLAIALGGLGQLAGAALFVANMWWRVRTPAAASPPR